MARSYGPGCSASRGARSWTACVNSTPPPLCSDIDVTGLPAPADNDGAEDIETDLAAVQHELARLPVVEREVLTLFYLQELSLGEVAEVLGVPVGTVKSRLFRARRLLRREIDQKRGNE